MGQHTLEERTQRKSHSARSYIHACVHPARCIDTVHRCACTRVLAEVLVFANTKRMCEQLAQDLWQDRINCATIHGDREQRERDQAAASFRIYLEALSI